MPSANPDIVVIGASGGGLAAGTALGVKSRVPDCKFFTAEPEGFDDTRRSFKSGNREKNPKLSGTICDALMTQTPGEITFPITRELIGDGVTANDAEVGRAVAFAFRELKLVVEPGGAIGLAALLAGRPDDARAWLSQSVAAAPVYSPRTAAILASLEPRK